MEQKNGIFIGAGGNLVFFSCGVLSVIERENINISKVVGFSSSAPVAIAYAFRNSKLCLDVFSPYLKNNKNNFYLFKKEHFPHNGIYRKAIEKILNTVKNKPSQSNLLLFASSTSAKQKTLRSILSDLVLLLNYVFHLNFFATYRKLFKIKYVQATEEDIDKPWIIDFIMGSSTLFPFIKPHTINSELIQEGALLAINPQVVLKDCSKKIVIHTTKGKSCVTQDTLNIYSNFSLGNNYLDYTDEEKIAELFRKGEQQMNNDLQMLQKFLVI